MVLWPSGHEFGAPVAERNRFVTQFHGFHAAKVRVVALGSQAAPHALEVTVTPLTRDLRISSLILPESRSHRGPRWTVPCSRGRVDVVSDVPACRGCCSRSLQTSLGLRDRALGSAEGTESANRVLRQCPELLR